MDVVLLAAGRGRRFGGAKQFEPVAPDGSTLLEVTIRECAVAGCSRAVVVTSPGDERVVTGLFSGRPVPGIEIVAVAQDPLDLPLPAPARDKPWGTAHAVWAARRHVDGAFLVFNADDYYGAGAADALIRELEEGDGDRHCAMLGYPLIGTLSESGAVSRALCESDDAGLLTRLTEYTDIDARGNTGGARLPLGALVSMNAWGLTPRVFDLLGAALEEFVRGADLATGECFLPSAIESGVRSGEIEVRVIEAPGHWVGMTWAEDREKVRGHLADLEDARTAATAFGLDSRSPIAPHGAGLVHATWRVGSGHLLQSINARVFGDPVSVVRNADAAARRIDHALRERGDDDPRHRLHYLRTHENLPHFTDGRGRTWRGMRRIDGARPARPEQAEEIREAAACFGRLPGLLAAGEGPEPFSVIPGFHDTPARHASFVQMLESDPRGRRHRCSEACDRLARASSLAEGLVGLPVRFVHNDAKLDNVLVDRESGRVLCAIDLDTVMPGLAAHDFGDLVRSAVTGRPEDEADLEQLDVRLEVFECLARGYLEGARDWITPGERASLVDGALAITFEQALRFLTDYLEGDVYYRVDDEGHNLRRARAQIRLLDRLLDRETELRAIVSAGA